MSRSTEDLMKLWDAAMTSKVGIAIETDDRKTLQQQLYRARQASNPEKYTGLVIVVPEKDGELWLVHRGADE